MATEVEHEGFDRDAETDEPMFILLARDRWAPVLVHLWASLSALNLEDPNKAKEARKCAKAMEKWKRENAIVYRQLRNN